MASVYSINKGVSQPVVFKGLKAQYIWYLGGGLAALLVLFAALYILGVNMFICLALTGILAAVLVSRIYRLSNKYGEFGMMKKAARRMLPPVVRSGSRRCFRKDQIKWEGENGKVAGRNNAHYGRRT